MVSTVTDLIATVTKLRRLFDRLPDDPERGSETLVVADRLAELEHENNVLRALTSDKDDVDHHNQATADASLAAHAVRKLHDLVWRASLASTSEFLDFFELPKTASDGIWEHTEWVVEDIIDDTLASLEAALARKLAVQELERDPNTVDSAGRVNGFTRAYLKKNNLKPSQWCVEYCRDLTDLIVTHTEEDNLPEDLAALVRQAGPFTLDELRALIADVIWGEMGSLEALDFERAADDLSYWLEDIRKADAGLKLTTEMQAEAINMLVEAREFACLCTAYSALATCLSSFETPTVARVRRAMSERGEKSQKIPKQRRGGP